MGLAPLAWIAARTSSAAERTEERKVISTKRRIGYIRPEIPHVEIPAYRGVRYTDHVPETLDIAEHARLAIHALTALTDPEADHEIYFYLRILRNPPVLAHDHSDWCEPKFMEALPLLRLATGESLNSEVDRAWMDVILK